MQGNQKAEPYTALLPGTPSQPAHEDESPPHTPQLSTTDLPLGTPAAIVTKRAAAKCVVAHACAQRTEAVGTFCVIAAANCGRGSTGRAHARDAQCQNKFHTHTHTHKMRAATTNRTKAARTSAQVHFFAAHGHAVAALARAVRAPAQPARINHLAAVGHTITPHARNVVAEAHAARVQRRVGAGAGYRHRMPEPQRHLRVIPAHAAGHNVDGGRLVHVAHPQLPVDVLAESVQDPALAVPEEEASAGAKGSLARISVAGPPNRSIL